MNYYKRLLKNRPAAFFLLLALGIIGLFIIYAGVNEIMISLDEIRDVWGVVLGILFSFYGVYLTYWSFVSGPMTSAYALDKEDFKVTTKGDFVHIKYKKYEIVELKENVKNNYFRDKKGRKIYSLDRKRIYNAMIYLFPKALEKALNGKKEIMLSQVSLGFSDKKKMTRSEKIDYIKKRRIRNRVRIITFLSATLVAVIAILVFAKYIPDLSKYYRKSEIGTMILLGMIVALDTIFLTISALLFKYSFKDIRVYNRIMQKNMYKIKCNIWDKVCAESFNSQGEDIYRYYVKISDERYVCSDWIEVREKTYRKIDKEEYENISIIVLEDREYPLYEIIVE